MKQLKWIYYGVGAFIGFGCGTVINMIFYWLEQSGNRLISNMVRDFGVFGRFAAEMINLLPLFGVALGIIMVYLLFREDVDAGGDGPEGEGGP